MSNSNVLKNQRNYVTWYISTAKQHKQTILRLWSWTQLYFKRITSMTSLSCHEQVCLTRLRFWEILLPSSADDGRSISRNVASLNVLVHDVINFCIINNLSPRSNLGFPNSLVITRVLNLIADNSGVPEAVRGMRMHPPPNVKCPFLPIIPL